MKISKLGPEVTHLLFANDSLLFCEVDAGQIKCIRQILQDYEACSGKKENLEKSSIFFSKNTPQQVNKQVCREI